MRQGGGFDLSQVSWKAFSKEAMFDRRWYLRRERLVIYTATMLVGMAAQCAATYCMFKYKFLRNHIQEVSLHVAHVHDSDIEAATILGMIFPCFVTLLFNAEYFLLLFWPAKTYPKWYINAKKWTFVGITFGMVATVIIGTVIVARRSASITGVDMATAQQLTTLYFRPPLKYNSWPQNIAWLVLLWIAVALNVASTILMLLTINHDAKIPTRNSISTSHSDVADDTQMGSTEIIAVEDEKSLSVMPQGKSLV